MAKWKTIHSFIHWEPPRLQKLTLKVLNFWKFTSYCSLKPLWSGMGEVVPARTSPTLHLPSPTTVHQLSWLAMLELIYLHLPTDCFMKISLQSTGPKGNHVLSLHHIAIHSAWVTPGNAEWALLLNGELHSIYRNEWASVWVIRQNDCSWKVKCQWTYRGTLSLWWQELERSLSLHSWSHSKLLFSTYGILLKCLSQQLMHSGRGWGM